MKNAAMHERIDPPLRYDATTDAYERARAPVIGAGYRLVRSWRAATSVLSCIDIRVDCRFCSVDPQVGSRFSVWTGSVRLHWLNVVAKVQFTRIA